MSTVVVVKYAGESETGVLSKDAYKTMLGSALQRMTNGAAAEKALAAMVPSGTIGMKTNCWVLKKSRLDFISADPRSTVTRNCWRNLPTPMRSQSWN